MLLMSLYTGIPQGRSMPVYASLHAIQITCYLSLVIKTNYRNLQSSITLLIEGFEYLIYEGI